MGTTAHEARLIAALDRLTSDPAWRRAQAREQERKVVSFAVRLLAWDGESEELPELDPPGGLPPLGSDG